MKKEAPSPSRARPIIVGLPNLQDQIRMINRASGSAVGQELDIWEGLGNFLSEVYVELQHKKRVTVHRLHRKLERNY